jgi:hypothetical protein
MKTLQSFVASIKNASGLSHTLALIVGAGVLAYSTNASYKADVLALWGYVPHVLQVLLAVIAIPIAIYWNSQKNYSGVQNSQGSSSSGPVAMKIVAFVCLLGLAGVSTGCTLSGVLSEISSDVGKFSPLLGIAEGIVCVVGGPACAAVEAFVNIATPEAAQVQTATAAWSSASAAAQPGKLNQVLVALNTWQTQLKNGFNIPGLNSVQQAKYSPMIQAELNLTADAITLAESTQQAGGTTQAMLDVINSATPIDGNCIGSICYDDSTASDYLAFFNPLKSIGRIHTARKYRLKNGAEVHTWAYHKQVLVAACEKKSGNAAWDKQYAQIVGKIKALK